MLPVSWAQEADADLAQIIAYVGERNEQAAVALWKRIVSSVEPLSEHPYLYKASERVPGCREIVAHPNYIVVYRVSMRAVEILRVLHARRQYP